MHFFRRKEVLIIAGIGIVCFFPGCAKAPATELAAAKAAVKAAQDAEADKYMANNFLNLQKALEAAEAEVAKQNKSLFLARKYTRATELLTKTTQFATELQNEAPKAKEAAVAQVNENLGLVKGILQETADDIKKASRSKDKKSIIAELKADLSSADSVAALAAAEFKAGNVLKASDNLAEVQKLVKKITDALNPKPEM
jgi:hypothetical protein